jgi:hypothetical protein
MNNEPHNLTFSTRVQIGEVSCEIVCNNPDTLDNIKSLCSEFITNSPVDFTLVLNMHDAITPDQGDTGSSSGFAAEYLPETDTINAYIEYEPDGQHFDLTLLNRLFYYVYYSAIKIKQYSGEEKPLMIHACGILLNGKAILFAGPGGSGKSTVARLLDETDAKIINDEMLIISRHKQGANTFIIHGTPIIGDYTGRLNVAAPLDCVMILKKSPGTTIHPISQTEAYTQFIRQVVTPSYIGQTDNKAVLSTMADFTGELTSMVPFYVLEFNLDGKALWHELCRLKGLTEEGTDR